MIGVYRRLTRRWHVPRMEFDASIDLVADHLPEGLPSRDGVQRAREAVEALPGAGWISIEYCGHYPPGEWIRLFRPGRGEVMEGGPWDQLRANVVATIAAAMQSRPPGQTWPSSDRSAHADHRDMVMPGVKEE